MAIIMYALEFTDKELSVLQRIMQEEADRLKEHAIQKQDKHITLERDILLSIHKKLENAQQKEILDNLDNRKIFRNIL